MCSDHFSSVDPPIQAVFSSTPLSFHSLLPRSNVCLQIRFLSPTSAACWCAKIYIFLNPSGIHCKSMKVSTNPSAKRAITWSSDLPNFAEPRVPQSIAGSPDQASLKSQKSFVFFNQLNRSALTGNESRLPASSRLTTSPRITAHLQAERKQTCTYLKRA